MINSLLNQLVVLYPKSGYNREGRETADTGTNVYARFQETTRRRLLPDGSMVTIRAVAYFPADTTINTDDTVVYGGNTFKVFAKYATPGRDGSTNHIKVELLQWQ